MLKPDKDIKNIIELLIKGWNLGNLKYWDNQNKATHAEFVDNFKSEEEREELEKYWESSKWVIKTGDEKIDDSRSDYFDPIALDCYTLDDLVDGEPFFWIIKNNNIWFNLIHLKTNTYCSPIISSLYGIENKQFHVLLSNLNTLLFLKHKNNIQSKLQLIDIKSVTDLIISKIKYYLQKNKENLNINMGGYGVMENVSGKRTIYINNQLPDFKNSKNNNYLNSYKTFNKFLKKNKLNNIDIKEYFRK